MYFIVILFGITQQVFVRGRLFVAGDAVATAESLRSMELLWRSGLVLEIGMLFATIALAWVLHCLLRPVSKELSLLALLFCLSAVAVEASYTLRALEALFPLGSGAYLNAWTTEQLAAMSYLSARAHVLGFGVALLLFTPFFFVVGYLIFKSGYFPRVLGVLYQIAGGSYLAYGTTQILAPKLAGTVFAIIAGPAFIGELSLCLWLLIRGADPYGRNGWRPGATSSAQSRPEPGVTT